MIAWILTGLGGYLVGSFPSALLVGRICRGFDIRGHGSGNPGAANALRVLGPLPGAAVFILDIGKGLIAAAVPAIYLGGDFGYLSGLMAIVGHVFPIYAGFRGGKGLATACGAVAYLVPWYLAVFAPVWAAVYLWRRRVALASAAAIAAICLGALVSTSLSLTRPWPLAATLIGLALIFWRHWPEAREDINI